MSTCVSERSAETLDLRHRNWASGTCGSVLSSMQNSVQKQCRSRDPGFSSPTECLPKTWYVIYTGCLDESRLTNIALNSIEPFSRSQCPPTKALSKLTKEPGFTRSKITKRTQVQNCQQRVHIFVEKLRELSTRGTQCWTISIFCGGTFCAHFVGTLLPNTYGENRARYIL